MRVKDYMFTTVHTIAPEQTIAEAVKKMVNNKTNSLIVVNKENRPIGLVSSYTLTKAVVPIYLKLDPVYAQFGAEGTLARYAQNIKDRLVKDIMYKDIHILQQDDAMIEAASYLLEAPRRTLPVVDENGCLVGIITRTCIKNALYNAIFKDNPIDPHNGGNGN